mmetsp:Transcript_104529/g.185979  ORF Transcript_104529/g.185979 Transcript_104529/m.185979 type:complete len:87 (+) Transcript_104529:145-405(+)
MAAVGEVRHLLAVTAAAHDLATGAVTQTETEVAIPPGTMAEVAQAAIGVPMGIAVLIELDNPEPILAVVAMETGLGALTIEEEIGQ